jgi:hypothetical protein
MPNNAVIAIVGGVELNQGIEIDTVSSSSGVAMGRSGHELLIPVSR